MPIQWDEETPGPLSDHTPGPMTIKEVRRSRNDCSMLNPPHYFDRIDGPEGKGWILLGFLHPFDAHAKGHPRGGHVTRA